MPPASNLWILLRDGVSSTSQEVLGFLTPTPERLDGERDNMFSRQGPSWIPLMFVFGGSCSGCTVSSAALCRKAIRVREVREARHSAGLEKAGGISFLKRN